MKIDQNVLYFQLFATSVFGATSRTSRRTPDPCLFLNTLHAIVCMVKAKASRGRRSFVCSSVSSISDSAISIDSILLLYSTLLELSYCLIETYYQSNYEIRTTICRRDLAFVILILFRQNCIISDRIRTKTSNGLPKSSAVVLSFACGNMVMVRWFCENEPKHINKLIVEVTSGAWHNMV